MALKVAMDTEVACISEQLVDSGGEPPGVIE